MSSTGKTLGTILICGCGLIASAKGARAKESDTLSRTLSPGWNLVVVPFERTKVPDPWKDPNVRVWPVSAEESPISPLSVATVAPAQSTWLGQGGYWVYTRDALGFELHGEPGAPAKSFTTQKPGWHFMETAPNSAINKIVQWDASRSAYVPFTTLDKSLPGDGYFGYQAEEKHNAEGSRKPFLDPDEAASIWTSFDARQTGQPGSETSSWPTQPAPRNTGAAISGGERFEDPALLAVTGGPGLLARAALSEDSDQLLAHAAYVVRGDKRGTTDQVHYQRSEETGRPGSFSKPVVWSLPSLGQTVRDLALTAKGSRVSIAWIAYEDASKGQGSDVVVVQSHDGGRSFGQKTVVRAGEAWKRGLDIAYDAALNHHLVWGETNKTYYLKNLAGSPSNVFDDQRPSPLQEEAKYLIQEKPREGIACVCANCWCEGSETVGTEGYPIYRIERQVVQPSIHVGNDRVSIVVRQTRAFDPRPVPDPSWTGNGASPQYDDVVIHQGGRGIRRVVGWRKVWKTSQEPGDEALWDTLGGRFQYRYAGTWLEGDHIMLAQRPLTSEPLRAETPEVGGSQHTAPDQNLGDWKVSSVAAVGAGDGDNLPSYPRLADAPWGLVLVYEDGISPNPNRSGHNAIRFQSSVDGGQSWSAQETLGTGYLPAVAVSETGDVRVLYYRPHSAQGGTIVSRTREGGQSLWGEPTRINTHNAKPIHWKSHTETSDGLEGGVFVAAQADLFLAAWIEQTDDRDRIVTARASRLSEAVGYSVELPQRLTQGQLAEITVTAVNAYHMRVDTDHTLQVKTVPPLSTRSQPVGSVPVPGTNSTAYTNREGTDVPGESTDATPSHDIDQNGSGFTVSLHQGQVAFWADPTNLHIEGLAGAALLAPTSQAEGLTLLEGATGSLRPQFAPTVDGNYEKAKWLRDQLWRDGFPSPDGKSTGYQVEYEPVQQSGDTASVRAGSANLEGNAEDATFLAQHERVWVYTQGIALAQYAKMQSPQSDARAQALARTLCAKAVRSFDSERQAFVIRGWPFSWNTLGDTWKDARLVTGASAWALQGLGLFLLSEAFQSLTSDERDTLRTCYHESLAGLEDHRRAVVAEDGRRFSLMTAGWTTRGLVHARSPWKLKGPSGAPLAREGEVWDYYDVLDAIGYDAFNPENIIQVGRTDKDPSTGEPRSLPPKILTEFQVLLLKETVQAQNVVTEHNLDVLSVLNHALNHASALGINDVAHLTEWRDDVRNGIFQVLWDQDDVQWTIELEGALIQNAKNPDKQADIRDALSRGDWGRVVTGGGLRRRTEGPEATFAFIPNRKNTAIDNCSWLSLSVDYEDLAHPGDINALARCLEFTALAFSKDIAFQGKTYYGSHYFFDGFEDQYIQATDRQEQSFHLEATAGLIMGLLAFAEHHPEHEKSDFFGQEALALWAGVQEFVIDHDFPYSSQRIIDLSTLLNSSTAIIWFIDTYDQLNRHPGPPRANTDPLHREATPAPTLVVPPFGGAFLLGAQGISNEQGNTAAVQLSVLKWFLQLTAPQLAKESTNALVKTSVARSASQSLATQGGKSAGQVMLSEVILSGLGGTILGAESSKALLDFVNSHLPPTVHNIYVLRSPLPLDAPDGFKPVSANAFENPQEVQNMSLAEKALLAELALSPIDWSAPGTWGQGPGQRRPLLDLALIADMPTDIIVQESERGVQVFYGPRTANVGGYVVEVNQDTLRVMDRHTEETSELSADLSPVELQALLRLPELIRAWILRAPEPNQRGLLEAYLSQWIFTAGANPLPPVRAPSGGIPVVSGTADHSESPTGESNHESAAIDLRETPFSILGDTPEGIALAYVNNADELNDALWQEIPDEKKRSEVRTTIENLVLELAWQEYLEHRRNKGLGPPPEKLSPTLYVTNSDKTFEGASLPDMPTHPLPQKKMWQNIDADLERALDTNGELKRKKNGEIESRGSPINGYAPKITRERGRMIAPEVRITVQLKDGGQVVVDYLEGKNVGKSPGTETELRVMQAKLRGDQKKKWDEANVAVENVESVRYLNELLSGVAPGALERKIRQRYADDKAKMKRELLYFGRAQQLVKKGYTPASVVEEFGTFQEASDRVLELALELFGMSRAEYAKLFGVDFSQ